MNHYSRPGFNIWWAAFAIAATLPGEICWVITSTWTHTNPLLNKFITPVITWFFKRLAKTYGFVTMPPMPPRPDDTQDRARTVRQLSSMVRLNPNVNIGLAPEGQDFPDGKLGTPPSGAGRWIAHLAQRGLSVLPVGVFEENDAFCIRFGKPYHLSGHHPSIHHKQFDRQIADEVMQRIAACLPERMREDAVQLPEGQ